MSICHFRILYAPLTLWEIKIAVGKGRWGGNNSRPILDNQCWQMFRYTVYTIKHKTSEKSLLLYEAGRTKWGNTQQKEMFKKIPFLLPKENWLFKTKKPGLLSCTSAKVLSVPGSQSGLDPSWMRFLSKRTKPSQTHWGDLTSIKQSMAQY